MIYRITHERFLTHMIDHFPRETLINMEYLIISAGVKNVGRALNCVKMNELYPSSETVVAGSTYHDKKIMKNMYFDELKLAHHTIYRAFINSLMIHKNIVIIYKEVESNYIDLLVEYLDESFHIKIIDLNELFSKGRVGPFSIDLKSVFNSAVDVRRSLGAEMMQTMESTEDGRLKLLNNMSRKQKAEKLKELGISVSKSDKDLDQLLMDEWILDN